MTREQLEHIPRASSGITGADTFVVVGSQAILGQFPDPPMELVSSIEADLFSLRSPADADLIDGSIGELSPFHQTFGYYAHGVGEETALLPAGWKDRLIEVRSASTGGASGLCLEVHDLAVSKLFAGRTKDMNFVSGLLRHGLAGADTIRSRLELSPMDSETKKLCAIRLEKALLG